MKKVIVKFVVGLGFRFLRRAVLILPDSWLAASSNIIYKVALRLTGDADVLGPLAELIEIFRCGAPLTDTLRKIMREADVQMIQSITCCLTRPDPYMIK